MNPPRLLPIVIVAGAALIFLKSIGLVFDGGYLLAPIPEAIAQQQTEGEPAAVSENDAAKPTKENSETTAANSTEPTKEVSKLADAIGTKVELGAGSKSKQAVLNRLGERRKVLESRARDLELREQLLKAAEKRLEKRVAELKALEKKIGATVEAKKKQDEAKFADLVKMYESMKPKAAAAIFDRLDLAVLVPVAKQMSPRKLGDVMARMKPEVAERLTVALADTQPAASMPAARQLPKIKGRKPSNSSS